MDKLRELYIIEEGRYHAESIGNSRGRPKLHCLTFFTIFFKLLYQVTTRASRAPDSK